MNQKDFEDLKAKVLEHEARLAKCDTTFAVINTKLSAILWGVATIATALVGVLIKLIFNM